MGAQCNVIWLTILGTVPNKCALSAHLIEVLLGRKFPFFCQRRARHVIKEDPHLLLK